MSGCDNLKYPLCVEWTTHLPSANFSESVDFCFLDSKWYLELNEVADGYVLNLRSKTNEILKSPSEVTTSVRIPSNSRESTLSNFATLCKSHTTLWKESKEDIISEIGSIPCDLSIDFICIFHSVETNVSKTPQVSKDLESLSLDFSSLLKNESFSDVQLKCGDRSFSAHRSVLTARSEIFAAMFCNKLEEEQIGVKDMDPNVMEVLLKYMYSGKEPDVSRTTVRSLYVAADKYAVDALKKTCCDWMAASITENNCLELLVLADKHSDENLKKPAVHFISKRPHLLGRESWSSFKREHPHLAITVLEEFFRDAHSVQAS